MLKLSYNLIVLGCVVALVMASIVMVSPHDTDNYLAAALDKQHLLDTVKSPRIILVGGSNVAFSVDSEKIAKHFGMPVINMGLHVDLGLRYMLNEVGPALRKGDIVVIFPEYDHFSGLSLDGRPRELGSVIKFCHECISGISTPTQVFNVVSGIFEASESDIFRAIKKPKVESKVYTRQGFNAWGDMVAHLNKPAPLAFTDHLSQIKVSSPNQAIELLNTFYRELDTKNVQVFMMFPAIPIDEYKGQEENFKALYTLVETEAEMPIIGTPQDFIYAQKYFYDTFYHMNRFGREERTAHIINMLEPVIQK